MIKTKLYKRTGGTTTGGKTNGGNVIASSGTVDYARNAAHASEADRSEYAEKAGAATEAEHAKTADTAGNISEDAAIWDKVIRKDKADRTPNALTVGGAFTTERGIRSHDYVPDLTGAGYIIDDKGNLFCESATIRRFMMVPELRYNRTFVETGMSWRAPGGGVIERVEEETASTGRAWLRLENGEAPAIIEGGLCMGIWHFGDDADSTVDDDDGKGNFEFSGFTTVYFEITAIGTDGDGTYFDYQLREGWPAHPAEGMTFVGYGHPTDEAWQKSCYETRTYTRYLAGVTGWEYGEENIMMQLGDLTNLTIGGVDLSGYSAYLGNVYFSGVIQQLREAPLLLTLDTSGDPYVSDTRTCRVRVRAVKGVEDMTGKCSYLISFVKKPDGLYLAPSVSDGVFLLTHADLFGNSDNTAHVKATLKLDDMTWTAEADVIFRDEATLQGPKGDPGNSIKGDPGDPGAVGPMGAVNRMMGEWSAAAAYMGGETEVNGVRYADIVCVTDANGNRSYYRALKDTTGEAPATHPASWQPLSDLGAIYADMVFAPRALIQMLTGQEIAIGEDSEIWARLGLPAGGSGVIMYAGGATEGHATFTLDKNGMARFGTAAGRRILLDPLSKRIEIYNDSNELCATLSGETRSADEIGSAEAWTVSIASDTASGGTAMSRTVTAASITVAGNARTRISFRMQTFAQKMITGGGDDPTGLSWYNTNSGKVTASVVNTATGEVVRSETVSSSSSIDQTVENDRECDFDLRLSPGTYELRFKMDITPRTMHAGEEVIAGCSFDNVVTYSVSTPKFLTEIFANGLIISDMTNDYVKAVYDAEGGITFAAENAAGHGVRVDSRGIALKHHGGDWVALPQFIFSAKVVFSNNSWYLQDTRSFDGKMPTGVTKLGAGHVRINFPTEWQAHGLPFDLTAWDVCIHGIFNTLASRVAAITAQGIEVGFANGTTEDNHSFLINCSLNGVQIN